MTKIQFDKVVNYPPVAHLLQAATNVPLTIAGGPLKPCHRWHARGRRASKRQLSSLVGHSQATGCDFSLKCTILNTLMEAIYCTFITRHLKVSRKYVKNHELKKINLIMLKAIRRWPMRCMLMMSMPLMVAGGPLKPCYLGNYCPVLTELERGL